MYPAGAGATGTLLRLTAAGGLDGLSPTSVERFADSSFPGCVADGCTGAGCRLATGLRPAHPGPSTNNTKAAKKVNTNERSEETEEFPRGSFLRATRFREERGAFLLRAPADLWVRFFKGRSVSGVSGILGLLRIARGVAVFKLARGFGQFFGDLAQKLSSALFRFRRDVLFHKSL